MWLLKSLINQKSINHILNLTVILKIISHFRWLYKNFKKNLLKYKTIYINFNITIYFLFFKEVERIYIYDINLGTTLGKNNIIGKFSL